MQKHNRGVPEWVTRATSSLGNWIREKRGPFNKSLAAVKRGPVQKPKRDTVRAAHGKPADHQDLRELSYSNASNPDKIFQIGLLGLGISFVGLTVYGVIYLIIGWAMR